MLMLCNSDAGLAGADLYIKIVSLCCTGIFGYTFFVTSVVEVFSFLVGHLACILPSSLKSLSVVLCVGTCSLMNMPFKTGFVFLIDSYSIIIFSLSHPVFPDDSNWFSRSASLPKKDK